MRVVRELGRACDGCRRHHPVILLLAVGDKSARICGACFQLLVDARQRVFLDGLDALEVRPRP